MLRCVPCVFISTGLSQPVDQSVVATEVPIRWASIEVLKKQSVTTMSDVWSFGIVMWEIFTNGLLPYPTIHSNREVVAFIFSGKRLDKPSSCPVEIFEVMKSCWHE